MAKKENIIITPEGLSLLCTMCHYGYIDGFYGKIVYFSDGFKGDNRFLFQALGNIGAIPTRQIDEDVTIVIVGSKIMNTEKNNIYFDFVNTFQELINQNNSPYRKLMFLTEDQLISRLERRVTNYNDKDVSLLLKKYKDSTKSGQTDLYAYFDNEKND